MSIVLLQMTGEKANLGAKCSQVELAASVEEELRM
jgi:hypothetical protein